jgi:hypothetical protein
MHYVTLGALSHMRTDRRMDMILPQLYITAQNNESKLTRKNRTPIYFKADYSPATYQRQA